MGKLRDFSIHCLFVVVPGITFLIVAIFATIRLEIGHSWNLPLSAAFVGCAIGIVLHDFTIQDNRRSRRAYTRFSWWIFLAVVFATLRALPSPETIAWVFSHLFSMIAGASFVEGLSKFKREQILNKP